MVDSFLRRVLTSSGIFLTGGSGCSCVIHIQMSGNISGSKQHLVLILDGDVQEEMEGILISSYLSQHDEKELTQHEMTHSTAAKLITLLPVDVKGPS